MRLAQEELDMLRSVVCSAGNIKDLLDVRVATPKLMPSVAWPPNKEVAAGYIKIRKPDGSWEHLALPFFVPDVPMDEYGAAEKMLVFMGLESYPKRPAEFNDYIGLAYEFAKQHRRS